MKKTLLATCVSVALVSAAAFVPQAVLAQNIAIVNGKPVPKARADALMSQVTKQAAQRGQQLPPDIDSLIKDQLVQNEIFAQEAEKRGIVATADYKTQMDMARQSILYALLLADLEKKSPVTDADVLAEYNRYKAQASGTEYRAEHILVDKEDEAKALIAQIKAGAKFEDIAKKSSKDTGSAEKGGDLDFAPPTAYVPEFSQAMVKLQKGEMTDTPVKSQFGFHIIKLLDTRVAQVPPLEEVKPQIQQRLSQVKVEQLRDEIRSKAKTDYKFSH